MKIEEAREIAKNWRSTNAEGGASLVSDAIRTLLESEKGQHIEIHDRLLPRVDELRQERDRLKAKLDAVCKDRRAVVSKLEAEVERLKASLDEEVEARYGFALQKWEVLVGELVEALELWDAAHLAHRDDLDHSEAALSQASAKGEAALLKAREALKGGE